MNKVVETISKNIEIFDLFTGVYIFGSSLNNNQHANDIDLLIVYQTYSKEIFNEKNSICCFLEKLFQLPIDLTVLSEKELKETKFLEKLSLNYERLK